MKVIKHAEEITNAAVLNFCVTNHKVAVILEKTKRGVSEGVNSI